MARFTDYLKQVADEFPSKKALAEALGISQPRLSHALAGAGEYTFNVENCLRLAKIANRPATEVLRAAGKEDIAELLEFLFPKAGRPSITGEDRQLLDDWHLLEEDERRAFTSLIQRRAREKRRKHA